MKNEHIPDFRYRLKRESRGNNLENKREREVRVDKKKRWEEKDGDEVGKKGR